MVSNDSSCPMPPGTPEFKDITLVCIDCGKEFVLEAGEEKFFWDHMLAPPKRCFLCRKHKTIMKQAINKPSS